MSICETCRFRGPRNDRKTHQERWEEDPRPKRSEVVWWRRWWFAYYKDDESYVDTDIGDIFEHLDKIEMDRRLNYVVCCRYPEHRIVAKTHTCGEYR